MRWPAPLVVSLLVALTHSAGAQQPGAPVPCLGQTISHVEVTTRPPYEGNGGGWWTFPLRAASQMHVTTRPIVVRRFLLQYEGLPCDERLRAESERLLRAQPYLADALITIHADTVDGIIMRVVTTDELTQIVGVRADADAPWLSGLTLGEGNLAGQAVLVSASWREGKDRAHWAGRFIDYQFFGVPWILQASGARRDVGFDEWTLSITEPFFTDARLFAWHGGLSSSSQVFDFYRGDEQPLTLSLHTRAATIGGLARVGRPGSLALFGLAITGERANSGPPPPSRRVQDEDYETPLAQFGGRRSGRLNLLVGGRLLEFERVERFDALDAAQDMARGAHVGVALGRSMNMLGSYDDDALVAADVYAGAGTGRRFLTLHARGEARRDNTADRWDGILASATLVSHHRLHPRHTLLVEANWSGGWRAQVPFQLPLGSRDGGVRGHVDGLEAGGRRAVVSVEDRWYLGAIRRAADLGVAAFVDAGAVRAGDAPFGVDSPVRAGAGVGLLAAFPAGSRRTWRLDVAVPVNSDGHARWDVRLSTTNVLRLLWREPPEVTRSREQAVPVGLFSWP